LKRDSELIFVPLVTDSVKVYLKDYGMLLDFTALCSLMWRF